MTGAYYPLAAVLLLMGSALLSASETAFFSMNAELRERLQKHSGLRQGAAEALLGRPKQLLLTLLLGNLLVNLLYLSLTTTITLRLEGAAWSGGGIALSLLLLILLGEVLPKTVARGHPLGFCLLASLPVLVIERLFLPVVWLLARVTDAATRWLVGAPASTTTRRSEFLRLADLYHKAGYLGESQRRILHEVLAFSSLRVRDVMVPRVDLGAIDLEAPREEAVARIRSRPFSRWLAFAGDLDQVRGQLLAHEVLLKPGVPLAGLVRPIPAVPEQGTAAAALSRLRRERSSLCLVVDEYGGTAGILTMHDLMEELLGELTDEHLRPSARILERARDRFLVAGWTTLREWRQKTGTPEDDAAASTVGGLVLRRLDRPPREGDEVATGWFSYRVRRVKGGRVVLVEARRVPATVEEDVS